MSTTVRLRHRFSQPWIIVTLSVVLLVMNLACGGSKPSTTAAADAEADEQSRPFFQALDAARKAAAGDELASQFSETRRIGLAAAHRVRVSRFLPLADGFAVSDIVNNRVDLYDRDGAWRARVGKTGTAPGSFVFPTGLAALNNGEFAVLDFRPSRISVFNKEGAFVRSLSYTRHGFSGVQLAYTNDSDTYYLFGAKAALDDGQPVSKLVHRVTSAGALTGSWVTLPNEQQAPWAASYYEPVVALADGQLFCAFPFSSEIHRLTRDGTEVVVRANPEGFRAPQRVRKTTEEKEPRDLYYTRFHAWRLDWTPIDGLAVVGDTLLVATQTFAPLRYRLEAWSLSTRRRRFALNTNHLVIGAGPDGTVYFRESPDFDKEANDAVITATLR